MTLHALPIEPTVVQRMKDLLVAGRALTPQQTVALMQETYRAFVNDNAAAFAALFEHLLASDAPLVFHCTAGKDRTGFAAALILLALGVPRPVVMQDYLLTNELLRMDSAPAYGIPPEVMQVLWRVQAEFLDAARPESRGAHAHDDYPNRDDANWLKHTLWYSEGNRLEYKPVNLQPLSVDSVPPKVRTF